MAEKKGLQSYHKHSTWQRRLPYPQLEASDWNISPSLIHLQLAHELVQGKKTTYAAMTLKLKPPWFDIFVHRDELAIPCFEPWTPRPGIRLPRLNAVQTCLAKVCQWPEVFGFLSSCVEKANSDSWSLIDSLTHNKYIYVFTSKHKKHQS